MSIKEVAAGGLVTVIIGGAAVTVSQTDIIDNFAADTGMTQQEAEQYVGGIGEDDLVPYTEVGDEFINDGKEFLDVATQIDCINYEYEWESSTLTCEDGVAQFRRVGNTEISLGEAYKKLDSESVSNADVSSVIRLIDQLNSELNLEIIRSILSPSEIDDIRKTNSYNKAVLEAYLESS